MKHLWTRENALALPPGTRFGIDVAPHAPRFAQFEAGRARLLRRGWVAIGAQKGLTHLTTAGRMFCEAHRDEIEAHPQFYGAAKGD